MLHCQMATADPLETLRGVDVSPRMLEDDRPLTESIEWRLSETYWNTHGTAGFVQSEVPYTVTSSGTLSANAARLLFHNCCEHEPSEPIELLEVGAGTGLFARLFLDEFARLCERENKPFHRRVVYYVTDRSQRSIDQWKTLGLFDGLPAVPAWADALAPLEVGTPEGTRRLAGLRAVFCNYSLDSLPAAVLRKGNNGPEELCLRTHLTADKERIERHTKLGFDEIRELVRTGAPQLIPLVSLFELEAGFRPCHKSYPNAAEALGFDHAAARTILNHGAIQCLERVLSGLEPHGFVLVNDYGPVRAEDTAGMSGTQRFGSSAALGLNFPFLEHHFASQGATVTRPELDERLPIHPRLLAPNALVETCRAFHEIFDFGAHQACHAGQDEARQHIEGGRLDAAKRAYEKTLASRPRDWALLGEIAEFLTRQVGNYQAGLQVASSALAINPWFSVWLWNVYGDALYALERYGDAHEAYLKASRLEPADARTNLNLGYTFAQLGDLRSALESLGRGLAGDRGGLFQERLVRKQQQILAAQQARFVEEQEWLARRAARMNAQ
jgi:tetratricopeptide (TPR) repeat protein